MIVGNSSTRQQQIKLPDAISLNILIFGESQAGKTVLRRLLSTTQPLDKNERFTQTIGVEFSVVEDSIVSECFCGESSSSSNGVAIFPKVRLFEVVGGSRFRTLLVNPTSKLYDGCIFVLSRQEHESCEQSLSRMSHLLTEIEDCFRARNEQENESCDGKDVSVTKKSLKPIYVCFLNKSGGIKKEDDAEFLSVAKEIINKRIQDGEVRMFSMFEADQLPLMRQMLKEIILKALLEKTGSAQLPRIQNEKQEEKKAEQGGFMSKVANFFFGS